MTGFNAISAGDVTHNPEDLRFQYPVVTAHHTLPPVKKIVYREQVRVCVCVCGCFEFPPFLQDRFLPIANIARIMRNALPKNGKVPKPSPVSRSNVTHLLFLIPRCQRMQRNVCRNVYQSSSASSLASILLLCECVYSREIELCVCMCVCVYVYVCVCMCVFVHILVIVLEHS